MSPGFLPMKSDPTLFATYLEQAFPDAHCSLVFHNPFEALVAVMLSAQTTDESVNKVTPNLFEKYPDPFSMSKTSIEDLEACIKTLGLFHNKAKNLSLLSKKLVELHQGSVPSSMEELTSLPGVGIKTANVVTAECFARPSIPVDTHVARVSRRNGYAKESDEPERIEKKLEKIFPKESWILLHHRIIAFGREICHARNPECNRCGLSSICPYRLKALTKTGK